MPGQNGAASGEVTPRRRDQRISVIAAKSAAKRRRRHRDHPLEPFDKRTVIGKRVKQLTTVFRERLGADADDPITAAAIRRAAETTALSEDLRARMLRGEPVVSIDHMTRLSRTADLLTRRLHLDRYKVQQPRETLAQYL